MIKNIIFDFDGVIVDSLPVRKFAFREIFKNYDKKSVDKLIEYHDINGGLSRFVKIRYFYNKILNKNIDNENVNKYSELFSEIIKEKLIYKSVLISETINYIQRYYKTVRMHIASGSEEKELRFLNEKLDLSKYFISIYGSPKPKIDVVSAILNENDYDKKETILIGDSINDYEAAKVNDIRFFGYNNIKLKDVSDYYIYDFNRFEKDFFIVWNL